MLAESFDKMTLGFHFDTNETHLVSLTSGFRSHMSVTQDVSFGMSMVQAMPFCQSKTKVNHFVKFPGNGVVCGPHVLQLI